MPEMRTNVLSRASLVVVVLLAAGLAGYKLFGDGRADRWVYDKTLDLLTYLLILNLAALCIRRRIWKRVLAFSLLFCVVVDGLTGAVFAGVVFKRSLPDPYLLAPIREIYMQTRQPVQSLVECAQYDPEITYTLRPGECRFQNAEFDTTVRANSMGLRDDEASLLAPELIAAGDSFTMGWGVQGEETYPSLVEKASGLNVLNAGVSSYGTVREMLLLRRLDLTNLRYLVIQYMENDAKENFFYRDEGNRFRVTPRDAFEQARLEEAGERYFFGRYSLTLLAAAYGELKKTLQPLFGQEPSASEAAEEDFSKAVPPFVNALEHAAPWDRLDVSRLEVLVLADRSFCDALGPALRAGSFPMDPSRVRCEPVFSEMDRTLGFRLDDHWNPAGHRAVSGRVMDWLDAVR